MWEQGGSVAQDRAAKDVEELNRFVVEACERLQEGTQAAAIGGNPHSAQGTSEKGAAKTKKGRLAALLKKIGGTLRVAGALVAAPPHAASNALHARIFR